MKNFIQPGDDLDIVAPSGGVTSGDVFISGSLVGIVGTTAAEGAASVVSTRGVFAIVKTSAQAWTLGAKVYWDATAKAATTTSTSNTLIGIAAAAAANPSSSGLVKIGPTL